MTITLNLTQWLILAHSNFHSAALLQADAIMMTEAGDRKQRLSDGLPRKTLTRHSSGYLCRKQQS